MKRTSIGGQALMEGIMMRNGNQYAMTVRKPDHSIETKVEKTKSISDDYPILKAPFLRGVVNFAESLVVGMKSLNYSASFFEEDEEEENPKAKESKEKKDRKEEKKSEDTNVKETKKEDKNEKDNKKEDNAMMFATIAISLVISIALFMIAPYLIASLFESFVDSMLLMSLIEGLIKILIFLGYIVIISNIKDIKRTYMYHGAEHKTINCLESGEDLTVENVKKHSRIHKRCGTSFLLFVILISIVLFMFIRVDSVALRITLRLLLIPVIAGISYELIRLAGKSNSKIIGLLSKPGMALQRLTTKEPEDDMIEVAIASVEAVFDWKPYVEAVRKGEIED